MEINDFHQHALVAHLGDSTFFGFHPQNLEYTITEYIKAELVCAETDDLLFLNKFVSDVRNITFKNDYRAINVFFEVLDVRSQCEWCAKELDDHNEKHWYERDERLNLTRLNRLYISE